MKIDVSAELDGFWSDNGESFVLGEDVHNHQELIDASKPILFMIIDQINDGVRISDVGCVMETEAKIRGFKVIKNLTGHGIESSLHEAPLGIANFRDRFNLTRFYKDSVVAIETFISTRSNYAQTLKIAGQWQVIKVVLWHSMNILALSLMENRLC